MTQGEKELLLKDLCSRIMYGVKCTVYEDTSIHKLSGVLSDNVYNELYFKELDWKECDGFADVQYCKPYLFPLSSMTEEQCYELSSIRSGFQDCWKYIKTPIPLSICNFEQIDWFNKNHLDYRGLIPLGLAIDCTNLNIY